METFLGIVRHLVTFGGGFAVAKGYIGQEQVEPLAGALVTLFGVVWSVLAKSDRFPRIK